MTLTQRLFLLTSLALATIPEASADPPAATAEKSDDGAKERPRKRRPMARKQAEPEDKRTGQPATDHRAPRAIPAPVVRPDAHPVQTARDRHPEVRDTDARVRVNRDGYRSNATPAYRGRDHRYARPGPYWHRQAYEAHHPPPHHHWYHAWYSHWWVHPWYRWTHATVAVVSFEFGVNPWIELWEPPPRPGWVWVPGHWEHGLWFPGQWRPVGTPPAPPVGAWVWVPGWWMGNVYFEGYWRVDRRNDGDWVWVEGARLADGRYVWGHWAPASPAPAGFVWEPGFWDGEQWVEGFLRPASRPGYAWVDAQYGDDGVYRAGYWEPLVDEPGHVWIPGCSDGERWIPGYWVEQSEYDAADPKDWQPEEGWDQGYDATGNEPDEEDETLAMPAY